MKIGNTAAGSGQTIQPIQKTPMPQAGGKVGEGHGVAPEVREDFQAAAVSGKGQGGNDTGVEGVAAEELMKKSIDQANKTLAVYDKYIERTVHEKTHAVMYTVKDKKTNEVIAEFPPKKIQDMIAKMWELAGLFVDEKA